jgi:hypothetical protein
VVAADVKTKVASGSCFAQWGEDGSEDGKVVIEGFKKRAFSRPDSPLKI